MATKADTKKHLEAILGEELSENAVQLIQLTQSVASTTDSTGMSAKRNLLIEQKTCRPSRLLDVNGFAHTGSNGQGVLQLTRFVCLPVSQTLTFVYPITVVATPLSSKPCFLTIIRSLVNNGADVEIKVFSWNANGAVEPNISFDWRCRAEVLLPPIL